MSGILAYETPSVMDLFGQPLEAFGGVETLYWEMSLVDFDSSTQALKYLKVKFGGAPSDIY